MSARSITPSPVLRCLHLTRPLPSPQTSFMDDLLDIFAQKDDITLSFLETKPNKIWCQTVNIDYPFPRTSAKQSRAFSVVGPSIWNGLPSQLRTLPRAF